MRRKHSTAQHSAVNPHEQQSKYAPIRARQRRRADRVGSIQHVVEAFIPLAAFSKRTKKSKSARPTRTSNHCNRSRSSLADVMMLPVPCCFSPSFLFRPCMRRQGLFSWTMELLPSASRQFAPKTMDLSVRFIPWHFVQFFLVSERSGRRKPPADRSTLYYIQQSSSIEVTTTIRFNSKHTGSPRLELPAHPRSYANDSHKALLECCSGVVVVKLYQ